MTDPTIDDKIRAVCAKLPELGWKPGMKCAGCFDRQYWTKTKTIEHHGNLVGTFMDDHAEHDTPPPVLDAAFHLKLETALLQHNEIIYARWGVTVIRCQLRRDTDHWYFMGEGSDSRIALLDAAWKLLGGKEPSHD